MTLKLLAIDHVVLRTTREAEMVAFYCDVLGCSRERDLPRAVGLIQLRAGTSLIDIVPVDSELGRLGGKPPSQDGRNLEHFCLSLADIDEEGLLAHLASHGIDGGEPARRYGATGFSRSVYINDPEGNVVELKLPSMGNQQSQVPEARR